MSKNSFPSQAQVSRSGRFIRDCLLFTIQCASAFHRYPLLDTNLHLATYGQGHRIRAIPRLKDTVGLDDLRRQNPVYGFAPSLILPCPLPLQLSHFQGSLLLKAATQQFSTSAAEARGFYNDKKQRTIVTPCSQNIFGTSRATHVLAVAEIGNHEFYPVTPGALAFHSIFWKVSPIPFAADTRTLYTLCQ